MTEYRPRDDLFTHIHKALRLALFQLSTLTGSTDWSDPTEVAELHERWGSLVDLLRAHTSHEDRHILRLLDSADPGATQNLDESHRDLDDLLDELDREFGSLAASPESAGGLSVYRDLNRFIAEYLPHLHDEETRVMARIWECCTDEAIAAARQGFMAETTPTQLATTLEYMLPALDQATRKDLVAGLAATAPPPVRDLVLDVAERVLTSEAYQALMEVAGVPSV